MNKGLFAALTLGGVLGGGGATLAQNYREPDYYTYDAPQTDSIRTLLNLSGPARLKLEKRPKGSHHIWVSVIPLDSTARLQGLFEVEESWPCPPRCAN